MKIQDLRIGNWVSIKGTPTQITPLIMVGILESLLEGDTVKGIEPIVLTEEIVCTCKEAISGFTGFYRIDITQGKGEVKGEEPYIYFNVNRKNRTIINVGIATPFDNEIIGLDETYFELPKIKYVHQLQNLIHAVSGISITLSL